MVIDESIYAFRGSSVNRITIPRKPHPNGVLSYGISGYTSVRRLPMLLDIEPWVSGNKLTPRKNAQTLVSRTLAAHPGLQLHIVVDAAFGSFDDIIKYHSQGVLVTASMSSNQKSWLWDLLQFECPLECGRTAVLPMADSGDRLLASLYYAKTPKGKAIHIRTATSAFIIKEDENPEVKVASVGERRTSSQGQFEYKTDWADGDTTWENASSFVDRDGTINSIWREKANDEDFRAAFDDFSKEELQTANDRQGWQVRALLDFSPLFNLNFICNLDFWQQGRAFRAICKEDAGVSGRYSDPHQGSNWVRFSG